MSALRRITIGTAGAWTQLFILFAAQVAAVPIYLSHWEPQTYGSWLLAMTSASIFALPDLGHHTYLAYALLKSADKSEIARTTSSAIPFAACFGTAQFGIALTVALLVFPHFSSAYLEARWPMVILSGSWMAFSSVGGVLGRSLFALRENHRLSMWTALGTALQQIAPLATCYFGGRPTHAAFAMLIANAGCNAFIWRDVARCWKRHNLRLLRPTLTLGYRNAKLSLAVTLKELFLNLRQQGVRVVLAPLASPASLAAFSVNRTAANVAQQGLSTITSPAEPELLRALAEGRRLDFEALMAALVSLTSSLFGPAVVAFAFMSPSIFAEWTHGRIAEDRQMLALLLCGVVLYAASQPFVSIVRGNNILRPQLLTVFVAGAWTILGTCALVPSYGIRAVAFVLLLSELIALGLYVWYAIRWLKAAKQALPFTPVTIGGLSVLASTAALLAWGWKISTPGSLFLSYFSLATALTLVLGTAIYRDFRHHLTPRVVTALNFRKVTS